MFLLDTNVVIGAMARRAPLLVARIEAELARGTPLRDFLAGVAEIVPLDAEDASEAGDIRAFLEKKGTPIGPYDALIAAQTRRRLIALVTDNRREFDRVPGLIVTDWAAA
jgi:tRNA(fMet)-specific endonuclease VapC